jgi:hypothetical protein
VNQTDHRVNVAIVGDSMVKHLNSSKLHKGSKRNVQVQTFRGANVADMNTSANNHVNFHAVPRNKGVAEIEVVISEVIIRLTIKTLGTKFKELNHKLLQICNNNKYMGTYNPL